MRTRSARRVIVSSFWSIARWALIAHVIADRALEIANLLAWVEPQVSGQATAETLVDAHCIALASTALHRCHEEPVGPLE